MTVAEGATFNVNNEVVFNKKDTVINSSTQGIFFRVTSSTSISDAKLIVNGTLNFNSDNKSNAYIAAYIEHNTTSTNATLAMDRLSSDQNLLVTYGEGSSNISITLETKGPFATGDGRFVAGNPYTSNHSGTNYYWEGFQISDHTITVNIQQVTDGVVLYSILNGQMADGSDAVATSLNN